MNIKVSSKIEDIRQDRTHGASWLSIQAINVMNLVVAKSEAMKMADSREEMKCSITLRKWNGVRLLC